MAAYNVERELPVLLDSLVRAEPGDLEVCICDDASTDRTASVIESYRDRLEIRAVRNADNRGVTYARNRALELAGGELLLFLDADVRLYPDTIARLIATMEETAADVVCAVYTDVALDPGFFSRYYAAFVHHSFLVAPGPIPYNVFNAWCSLARREVMDAIEGHRVVDKGVELENESLGRRIVSRGFSLVMDPRIGVDHHWGGLGKLHFIFTRRVYYWVKVFFASGLEFESALTTKSYGLGTPCGPAALVTGAASLLFPPLWLLPLAFGAGFLAAYAPFYVFAYRRRGPLFAAASVPASLYFSCLVTASAAYSSLEEIVRLVRTGRTTVDASSLRA